MSAIAALKGYRTQFLYSLYYILSNIDANEKFKLEGIEDLDILDQDDNVIKIIQVKNLADPLVLSDIHSHSKSKTSFLYRYIETQKSYPKVNPIIISFGIIGPELSNWKTSDIAKKKRSQFNDNEWTAIKNKIELIKVDEDDLLQQSLQLLKQKFSSIDPIPTIDFLLYWLSVIAEKQQIINSSDLVTKVEQIAQYLSERIAITMQYGVYISALHLDDHKNEDIELLKAEFYRGVNARYAHIIHNIDIDRPDFIKKIKSGFDSSSIVLLQGASGQGKSTLAYRYAYNYASSSSIYELNIQDNSEQSRLAILSIQSMVKSLDVPILFLINTLPNSIEWIKIVQEFSVYTNLHFLVTIRQEDYYKAQGTGLKFKYNEVELSLSKNEAEDIYKNIVQENIDLIHLNFEEAWIKFGEAGPLLEFIHTIVKGDSLKNTLRAQVRLLEEEANVDKENLITLLRLVAIADTFGARVSLEKLKVFTNLQSIIKRLDKEYLVKISNDKKYLSGLHPLRSFFLLESLFDEFVLTKKEFALEYILLIEDKDVYHFVLNLLYQRILVPDDLLKRLKLVNGLSWTYYYGILKGLIWAGIDQYVFDNKNVLMQAYSKFGDFWWVLIDIYFGNTNQLSSTINSVMGEGVTTISNEINSQLTDKQNVFIFAKSFLSHVKLPDAKPIIEDDWLSYGEMAFWLSNLSYDQTSIIISEEDYKRAFETLPIDILSIVMFGMTCQSEVVSQFRYKFLQLYADKFRTRFDAPELIIEENNATVNYIVDITTDDSNPKPLNERSVEMILLLRKAFPEKNIYSAQGYGHRFLSSTDETVKSIPAQSLPYEQWVEINSIVRKKFEYPLLPKTWEDYNNQLHNWDLSIKLLIDEFIKSFNFFYKSNLDANSIAPLVNNANYKNLFAIKKPQSITDPLGIYFDRAKSQTSEEKNKKLSFAENKLGDKYKMLFKGYSDYSSSIENFIRQSGTVIYQKLKQLNQSDYTIDRNQENLSITNLFTAAIDLRFYNHQKAIHLSKFMEKKPPVISDKLLISTVYIWKQFVLNRTDKEGQISAKSNAYIDKFKADFELRLVKNCNARAKKGGFTVNYLNNAKTQYKPVFKVEIGDPLFMVTGLKEVFTAIKESIGEVDYISLKYFVLEYFFEKFYILPIVQGKSLNRQWHRFKLYTFYTYEFDKLEASHWMSSTLNNDWHAELNINDWADILPKITDAKLFMGNFFKISTINRHLVDLKELTEKDIDEAGSQILTSHYQNRMIELQTTFQSVLDYMAELINKFPYDDDCYRADEMERQYWECFFTIRNNLFPTDKGEEENYEIKITMEIMESWKSRLAICMQQIGFMYFFICGKMIQEASKVE